MEKAYDIKDLVAKLKDQGLDMAEEAAVLIVESTFDWVIESAAKSENKIDDIVAPILTAVKPWIKDQIDRLDGEQG